MLCNQQARQLFLIFAKKPAFDANPLLIPSATWQIHDQVKKWADSLASNKAIVVYCIHGHEVSQNAARALRDLGFDASYLQGGFETWQNAGLPLDQPAFRCRQLNADKLIDSNELVQANKKMTKPTLKQITKVWAKIGLLSFGGPAGQIALMHRELVEKRSWLTDQQFLNALNFCMLLPGPEAMQLATYAGWKAHGQKGGLIAGLLFIIPGALVIIALSAFYAVYGKVPFIEAVFLGVKAAVLAIVVEALIKVSKRAANTNHFMLIAVAAFIALFFFSVPFPLIIVAAALFGMIQNNKSFKQPVESTLNISMSSTILTIVKWLIIWLAPLAILAGMFGPSNFLTVIGKFFSKLAVVTFGGAYAVLAYMAQQAVENFGWLTAAEMVDGLGLAETTPGPLILVTQFVGFKTGFNQTDFAGATAASLVVLWVTFAPCFLWIFAGAPYIEKLDTKTIGPATFLLPEWSSMNLLAFALAGLAGLLLTLAVCAALAGAASLV